MEVLSDNIKDYNRYTSLMRNGFYDKLFFIDKLFGPWESLLDYGCADGFLTKIIAEIFPDKKIVGYDSDTHMIDGAKYRGSYPENVSFLTTRPEKPTDVLLLSSVIHEVYSYGTPEEIEDFWDWVFESGFKTIIIRDMLYAPTFDFRSYGAPVTSIRKWCEDHGFLGELKRYEELWGPLESNDKNVCHFLLKYPYMTSPNWNREIKENYLPLSINDISERIEGGYRIFFQESYALPYLAYKWYEDFKIVGSVLTHGKLIIVRG